MPPDPGEPRSAPHSTWKSLGKALTPVPWDWPAWLPRGFLTILASQPGAGKSLLALHLAARYLRDPDGDPLAWPDGEPVQCPAGKIIWCESEAAHALNVQRARRFNLDLSRILVPLKNPLRNFSLNDPDHYAALLHHARRDDVHFVVLDSLRGLHTATRHGPSLSQILTRLADIARVAVLPILLIHHLRKRAALDSDGQPTVDSLLGASTIAQTARVIWALDRPDPYHPQQRRLSVIKNNLAPSAPPLGMTIDNDGLHFGPPPQPPTIHSELDRACHFLRDLLAPGPLPYKEIEQQSHAAGFATPTIRRAKKQLGIPSIRLPGKAQWHWTLPGENTQS